MLRQQSKIPLFGMNRLLQFLDIWHFNMTLSHLELQFHVPQQVPVAKLQEFQLLSGPSPRTGKLAMHAAPRSHA